MNVQHFNGLFDHQKTEVVLKAKFLADRLTNEHYIRLYTLESFFIEVFFDDETHLIDQLRAFKKTEDVLPYLEDIEFVV